VSLRYSYIGFGGNLGRPQDKLPWIVQEMNRRLGTVRRISRVFRTTPWGGASGPDYVNAVIELETMRTASDILQVLRGIEMVCGRERPYSNAPRACDLDLLLHGDEVISEPGLDVPHPWLHLRRFVLAPLCDLIPEEKHPVIGISFRELLEHVLDAGVASPIAPAKSFSLETSQ
jgi:2-amino-4-hydroxy-6-hydroxymethyldihydropteridine diphosphokinase